MKLEVEVVLRAETADGKILTGWSSERIWMPMSTHTVTGPTRGTGGPHHAHIELFCLQLGGGGVCAELLHDVVRDGAQQRPLCSGLRCCHTILLHRVRIVWSLRLVSTLIPMIANEQAKLKVTANIKLSQSNAQAKSVPTGASLLPGLGC